MSALPVPIRRKPSSASSSGPFLPLPPHQQSRGLGSFCFPWVERALAVVRVQLFQSWSRRSTGNQLICLLTHIPVLQPCSRGVKIMI